MRFILAAMLALAMSFPALAQPVCQFVLPDAVAQLEAQKIPFVVLDADQRADFLKRLAASADEKGIKHDLTTVTDVLVAELDGEMFFGLVRDGCLSPPVPMADFLPDQQISGITPSGKIGA